MRKLIFWLTGITVLVSTLVIGAALASAQWIPRGMELAFSTERDGVDGIYLLAVRHGLSYRVTTPQEPSREPVWSPDGERLLFQSFRFRRNNLFFTEMTGPRYNERRLTGSLRGDRDGVWSPDGRPEIVFVSSPGANNSIYKMNVFGEIFSEERITAYDDVAYAPDWRHNEVIFVAIRNGSYDIYAVNPQTGIERQLTDDSYIDSNPVWSPDGQYFAYQSYREEGQAIFVAAADGRNAVQLTSGAGNNFNPIWSPDGRYIAFISQRDGNEELYLVNPTDPESVQRLTTHPAADRAPVWSPDSKYLAFVSYRDRNAEIYLLNVKSGTLMRVTDHPGEDLSPAWRP